MAEAGRSDPADALADWLARLPARLRPTPAQAAAWGEAIDSMRQVYAELIRNEIALEEKNRVLEQARLHVLQSEKMAALGRLVAGVAHELNNPVSFIYGNMHTLRRYQQRLLAYLEAIHADPPAAERTRLREALRIDQILDDLPSLIDGTLEGAERVSDIVRNLRALSFRDPHRREPAALEPILRDGVRWGLHEAGRPVAVAFELPAPLTVPADPGRLHQVVVNLVHNAADAMAAVEAPALAIAAHAADGLARITVRDNGPGFSEDVLPKVFDPFFTTKPVGQGTGLGLWICYEIVTDHGGTIAAANHPDGGGIITWTLPLAP